MLPPALPIMLDTISADDPGMAYDVERRPGTWVAAQARRRERVIWICVALSFALAGLMLALAIGHRLSIAAFTLFLALVIATKPYTDRYADEYIRWLRGAQAEESVGETLNALRHEGWIILHDVEQDREGNVDHIACGPNGVFMIETKARRYEDWQLVKAKRQAAKLHDELGVWVTPVICLHTRSGQEFRTHGVWVVPRLKLLDWLRSQRNQPVPFDRLARFADHV